jgi:predicted lactoylglutathione lyase
MIGYVTLGTNDLDRAAAFYDSLLSVIGAARFMEADNFIAWGVAPDKPSLGVIKPFNGQPATAGNGTMISLIVDSTEKVNAMHARAMELGAKDEGAPGPRGTGGFYAAYFRDLDGNKLNCFFFQAA